MSRDPEHIEPPDVLATSEAGGKAIRGGVIRTVGYGAGLFLGLASAPFLIRHLGVVDFGSYVTVTSLVAIVGLISDAGLTVVGIREYATRDVAGRRLLMRNLLTLRLAIALVGVAGAIAFALVARYDGELVTGTALAGLGLLLLVLQGTASVPLTSDLRLGAVTLLETGRAALMVVLTLTLVATGADLLAFLAMPVPVGVAIGIAAVVLVGSSQLRPGFDRDELRRLVRDALPVAIAATIGSFFYRAVIVTMSVVAVEREVGYFSASFRILESLIAIPGLVTSAAFPIVARAARSDQERLRYSLQRLFDIGLIVGAWMALCVLIGADPAIAVIAGPDFEPSVSVLRIQAVVMLVSFLVTIWATGLWSLHRQRAMAVANLVGVAGAAALTAGLVPSLGAEGAALSMAIAEVLLAGCYAVALMRTRRDLLPNLAVAWRVALAVLPALAVWLLPLPDAVLVVAASVVYFAVLIAVRGVPPEVWAALRSR